MIIIYQRCANQRGDEPTGTPQPSATASLYFIIIIIFYQPHDLRKNECTTAVTALSSHLPDRSISNPCAGLAPTWYFFLSLFPTRVQWFPARFSEREKPPILYLARVGKQLKPKTRDSTHIQRGLDVAYELTIILHSLSARCQVRYTRVSVRNVLKRHDILRHRLNPENRSNQPAHHVIVRSTYPLQERITNCFFFE